MVGLRGTFARSSMALTVLLAALVIAAPRPVAAFAPSSYYAPATGQTLADPFLSVWVAAGALAGLGQPVTTPVVAGKLATQYFERGALQVSAKRKDNPAAPVTPIAVGGRLLRERTERDTFAAGRRVGGSREFLPATSTAPAPGPIADAYAAAGGTDRLGAPLSDAYPSANATVQWFASGRIDLRHGDAQATLAPIGMALAAELDLLAPPGQQGDLPALDAKRFHAYHGDGTVPEATGPFVPVEIRIPSIGVDAKIEKIGIKDGAMGTPVDPWNVGWYPAIASPGQWTNVVMAGHLDWWDVGPTVFYNLGKSQRGDKIYLIGADGTGATYQVMREYDVDADTNAGTIVADAGIEMLTLITCGGNFDGTEYLSRQIVRAKRI